MERLTPSRLMVYYVRFLGASLVLQGLGGAVLKVQEGRADDLVHNVVHLLSGLLALWVSVRKSPEGPSRRFAWGFGAFYVALGLFGALAAWPIPMLPLGAADHVFHLVVGALTLAAGHLPRLERRTPQRSDRRTSA